MGKHDNHENKKSKKGIKILFSIVLLIIVGIGAFLGALIGGISDVVIAMCLAFAGGAMLYIVSGELIPESNELYKGRFPIVGNILGFILGIFATML